MVTPRRSGAVLLEAAGELRESADSRRRERLDRTRRDPVDADALGAEACGEVADVRLKARLRESHDVVVGQRADRAEVGERQQRSGAPLQQRARTLGERRETVRADVLGDRERGARHAFEKIAGERLARRIRDRMQQSVEPAPFGPERGEQRVDLAVAADVAGKHRNRPELGRDLHDAVLEIVVDVGECEGRTLALARPRDAIGDRAVRQDPRDQNLLVLQKTHFHSPRGRCAPSMPLANVRTLLRARRPGRHMRSGCCAPPVRRRASRWRRGERRPTGRRCRRAARSAAPRSGCSC